MHRSGTSAVAKGLSCLGVNLGDKFMPPGSDNPKGFYEDIDIYNLNVEMLDAIGQHWFSLSLVTDSDIVVLKNKGFLERATALIQDKLERVDVFGFKDPRLSKLLKFWKLVFSNLNCEVQYVFCLRHPSSVTSSLNKRNKTPFKKGYYLWLSYNLAILLESQELSLVGLDYDHLMENPREVVNALAEAFSIMKLVTSLPPSFWIPV